VSKDPPPIEELRERVLFSLLGPAVRMAERYRVPLKSLSNALELAYFHQLRSSGRKLKEITPILDVGSRKGAELSRKMKSLFFEPERAAGVPRQIEHMLWPGPLSEARIKQLLGVGADEVDAALDGLVDDGRAEREEITRKNGSKAMVYRLVRSSSRLVGSSWVARVDGLNWLLRAVANVIEARFFGESDDEAFARVVTVHLLPHQKERLVRLYEDVIWPVLSELDREAEGDEEAEVIDFVLAFGPNGPMGNEE
jgi:hypothetical protein